MREAELMCQESVLYVIRENMPVEKILRAYIDETVDEEVIEETIEKQVTELEKKQLEEESTEADKKDDIKINKLTDTVTMEKPNLEKAKVIAEALKDEKPKEEPKEEPKEKPKENNIKLTIETPIEDKKDVVTHLKFNDIDSVVNYDKKASPQNNPKALEISAPKTLERLEKISYEANKQRKEEEAEEDDDDEKIKIFDNVNLELDKIDIHSLDKTLKLEPDPILTDIEILG
jgi:hypothetical protein